MLRPKLDPAPGALRLALALVGVLGLAGCGVKGPLEPPPGAHPTPQASAAAPGAAPATSTVAVATPRSASEMANTVSGQPEWKNSSQKNRATSSDLLQGAQVPNQPFILDGLL